MTRHRVQLLFYDILTVFKLRVVDLTFLLLHHHHQQQQQHQQHKLSEYTSLIIWFVLINTN